MNNCKLYITIFLFINVMLYSQSGVIDYSQIIRDNSKAELKGEWEIYKEKFYSPEDFFYNKTKGLEYVKVPHMWIKDLDIKKASYATYRVKLINVPKEKMALYIPRINVANRVWINNEEILKLGTVGKNSSEEKAMLNVYTHYFYNDSDTLEIIIQTSNFVYNKSGLYLPLYISTEDVMIKSRQMEIFKNAIIIGGILFISLFSIVLYFFRKKDKAPLYFGIFALVILIRILTREIYFMEFGNYNIPEIIRGKIEILNLYVGVFLFMMYFKSLYSNIIPNKIMNSFASSYFIAGIITIFINLKTGEILFIIFEIILLIFSVYGSTLMIMEVRKNKRKDLIFFLFGFIFMILTYTHDFFRNHFLMFKTDIFNYGFFFFIIVETLITSYKNSRSLTRGEELTEELNTYNEKLKETIEDRTQELLEANKTLEEAKSDADSANKYKSMFLANMSHELRTPLNGIIGMLDALKYTEMDKNLKRKFEIIDGSARHLLKIINEILDMSKIEAGKLDLVIEKFNLKENLKRIVDLFYFRANNKNVALNYYISEDIPEFVMGDSLRITQIISNLVSNAIKFTENGEVSLSIDLMYRYEDEVKIKFIIKDTGIGIPKEKLNILFEKFTQLDSSHSRKYGGTGLGLNISKQLVNMLGGKLRVDTKISKGSIFYFDLNFKLPFKIEDEELKNRKELIFISLDEEEQDLFKELKLDNVDIFKAKNIESGLKILEEKEKKGLKPKIVIKYDALKKDNRQDLLNELISSIKIRITILKRKDDDINFLLSTGIESFVEYENFKSGITEILFAEKLDEKDELGKIEKINDVSLLLVEDSDINIEIFKEFLNMMEINYLIAKDGIEALKILEKKRFDIILMDIQLPELNGFELTDLIRNRESDWNKIPIVAVTAHSFEKYREKCIRFGMNDYIAKPIVYKELLDVIKRNLKNNKKETIEKVKNQNFENNLSQKFGMMFIKTALDNIEKMKSGIENKNYKLIEDEAHKLKGSSAYMKEKEMYELVSEMEKEAEKKNENIILELFIKILEEYEKIKHIYSNLYKKKDDIN